MSLFLSLYNTLPYLVLITFLEGRHCSCVTYLLLCNKTLVKLRAIKRKQFVISHDSVDV